MRLVDFVQASDQNYHWLRQKIDELPKQQPLTFENCEMLPACFPTQATVQFHRGTSYYSVSLKERVRYYGPNQSMQSLSTDRQLYFQDFEDIKQFLQSFS